MTATGPEPRPDDGVGRPTAPTVAAAAASLLRRLAPFAALATASFLLTRLILTIRAAHAVAAAPGATLGAWAGGLVADLAVAAAFMVPVTIGFVLLPARAHGGRFDRAATLVGLALFAALLGFTAIGEQLFWTEFHVRFNFIAVDYLVYTHEVIGNVMESYPVVPMLAGLAVVSIAVAVLILRAAPPRATTAGFGRRLAVGLPVAAVAIAAPFLVAVDAGDRAGDDTAAELGRNGVHALVAAYLGNEIDYRRFYVSMDEEKAEERVEALLSVPEDDEVPGHRIGHPVEREIVAPGPERLKNVVVVVMESMGADFVGVLGDKRGLTPNLDRLASEGLLFTGMMATGNRTVRGLEAVTLSVPPTPGQSIVRRPDNGGLFSIGSVLEDRGYVTRFVYGGHGYFDNMNAFYAANGFQVTDRAEIAARPIRFANIWGVSDEDLFDEVTRLADADTAAGRPFLQVVMTTSNHRPYTYPEGAIDIAPGSGRLGGVKYADHAVGRLVAAAKAKPWFENTLFVFVADHTAGTAGRSELARARYRIPMIVWAPGFVAPRRDDRLASQIDVAPTIFGLLGLSYRSRFMGEDLSDPTRAVPARAFIATYQKIGLVRGEALAVLTPKAEPYGYLGTRKVASTALDPRLVEDTIAVYEYAADWRHHFARIDSRLPTR